MGEKKADVADKKNDGGANDKKEESGSLTVVYKLDMHCDGCAKKISKSVKKFQGVESVHGDSSTNKLTVKGKVDPGKLRENIEHKTKKKVELISPQPAKKEEKKDEAKAAGGGEDKKKTQENKPASDDKKKEVPVSTVVFKIRLHCDGCTQRIGKIVKKFKGVQGVEIDTGKDLVMVKGTMDVKELQHYMKERLKRGVEIVPPKKEGEAKKADGEGDKKGKDGDGDKKGKDGDGGEKKKEEGEKKKEGGGEKQEVKKMDHYYAYENGYGHGNGYGPGPMPGYAHDHGYGYGNGYPPAQVNTYYGNGSGQVNGYYGNAPAPQIFSDENPNACSVM